MKEIKSVRFQQESPSAFPAKMCPLSAGKCVRFRQEYVTNNDIINFSFYFFYFFSRIYGIAKNIAQTKGIRPRGSWWLRRTPRSAIRQELQPKMDKPLRRNSKPYRIHPEFYSGPGRSAFYLTLVGNL